MSVPRPLYCLDVVKRRLPGQVSAVIHADSSATGLVLWVSRAHWAVSQVLADHQDELLPADLFLSFDSIHLCTIPVRFGLLLALRDRTLLGRFWNLRRRRFSAGIGRPVVVEEKTTQLVALAMRIVHQGRG